MAKRFVGKQGLIDAVELSLALDCHPTKISQWIKRGLPVSGRSKGGYGKKPRNLFDLEACKRWVVALPNTRVLSKSKAAILKLNKRASRNEVAKQPARFEELDGDTKAVIKSFDADTIEQACDRIIRLECQLYAEYQALPADDAMGRKEMFIRWRDAIDQRRKLQLAQKDIALSLGEMIPKEKAMQELRDIASTLREKFLSLPGEMAGRVVGLDAAKICKALDAAVRRTLKDISEVK